MVQELNGAFSELLQLCGFLGFSDGTVGQHS